MAHQIVSFTEGTILNPDGTFTRTRIIRYMVGKAGPFQIEIPAADYTAEGARALIEAQVREIEGTMGGG